MTGVRIARVSSDALDVGEHLAAVADPASGAETSFVGRVRDHDPDASGAVTALEYTAHPDVEATLHEIAQRAASAHRAQVAVSHRIGRLVVGDAAVVIACSAGHRAEAFDACRAVIEDIKRELPVWKRQLAADGTAAWKGLGG
ncbi:MULTISPECIES: molybdenum cofactor biosynthesis protein MoaE [unclassified Microbacterium]|uniref:molybdenum cofactor biosynthesis protein MoaE n=1 Tax=unclassified Microbacterium TaxID=2609290 RepID=UPI00097F169C|nr:molybdenum cofactor biosynthesis protein MoaE [Microbacterium sp. JB110]RCS63167.1 molybdenum cofactor biosynthesis protein MoaE [Microbacterium sp. JB110]SJM52717.1 Molybdenum cofactor biosynthesis protein MoaE [Frigoribacterium sp. JB110]